MVPSDKALGLLGLARRAGGVAPGTEAAKEAVRRGQAFLVWMAEDASETQLEKLSRVLGQRAVPIVVQGDRVTLGAAVGRSALSAVAVTDRSLAERLVAELAASAGGLVSNALEV